MYCFLLPVFSQYALAISSVACLCAALALLAADAARALLRPAAPSLLASVPFLQVLS